MLNESGWKDKVDLKIYHLDENLEPGKKYQPVDEGTVIINGKTRLANITTYSFFRALEQAERENA